MARRILVVDDDAGIRRLVGAVLRRQQYATEEAADGQQAIDKLSESDYDAIFLDLMMPVADGYAVLEYLREQHPGRKCVVVMTAAGTRGTKRLELDNVFTILHKPFDIDDILTTAAACMKS